MGRNVVLGRWHEVSRWGKIDGFMTWSFMSHNMASPLPLVVPSMI